MRRHCGSCLAESQLELTVFVFAVELCRVVGEFAAPAFLVPGIAGGGVEERFERGDAGSYDADV